jgi:hypothetical protein
MRFRDHRTIFSGSLKNIRALGDLKMDRMFNTIDEWVEEKPRAIAQEIEREKTR